MNLDVRAAAAVFTGGALGTFLRYGISGSLTSNGRSNSLEPDLGRLPRVTHWGLSSQARQSYKAPRRLTISAEWDGTAKANFEAMTKTETEAAKRLEVSV